MMTESLVPALAAMVAYGIAGEIRRTGTISLLQIAVDDTQRGRVMSTQFLLQRIAGGIGTVLIGLAAESEGLRMPMFVAACLAMVAWAIAFKARHRIIAAFKV